MTDLKIVGVFDLDAHPELFKPLSGEFNFGQPRPGIFKSVVSPGETQIIVEFFIVTDMVKGESIPALALKDNNGPRDAARSLTNAMDQALNHVARLVNVDLTKMPIVYRDSLNQWDGVFVRSFDVDKETASATITRTEFVPLDCRSTPREAIVKMINKIPNLISGPMNEIFFNYKIDKK